MGSRLPHDVSPFLQSLRNFLLGRKHTSYLRFPERIAARTQPPPSLPEGCSSKLSSNYYCTRDGRRLITPPETVVVNQSSSGLYIASKSAEKAKGTVAVTEKKPITPGSLYMPPLVEK